MDKDNILCLVFMAMPQLTVMQPSTVKPNPQLHG